MSTSSDHELALRVRSGDTEAYGELVRQYQTSVFNVCFRVMGERREAEDMAQETFIRTYQRFDRYDAKRPFGPWVRRVAANLCVNQLKSRRSHSLSLDDEHDNPIPDEKRADNPEVLSEQKESAAVVRAAILSLPLKYRAVIELRHFQDMNYADIASQLQIPLSDVKSHLFRARKSLAQKLRSHE